MSQKDYRTAPLPITTMPPGIPCIVGNEAAERFSFYGLKCLLVVFMTKFMLDRSGNPAFLDDVKAREWFHDWSSACYLFPVLGAFLSDTYLGKYRTIILLSLVYCAGHAALFFDLTREGLWIGLGLIALGTGGIKPCVSAHVGDQFGAGNQHLLARVFGWFYFSINFGSFFSTLLTPWLMDGFCQRFGLDPKLGPHLAFGVPGVLMFIATFIFWLGRRSYAHIPAGGKRFWSEVTSPEGLLCLGRLAILYVFVALFWSLYDQTFSSWIQQAERMDRRFLGVDWLAAQTQAVNPLLILIYIPLFSYVIYPAVNRVWTLTPLRKMGIGFVFTAAAFLIPALIEHWLAQGKTVNIGWQLLGYVVLTAAEVMVSITGLEFSYTQSPRTMKSVVMSLWLLSVSLGNFFTARINSLIANDDGSSKLSEQNYYLLFAGIMAAATIVYVFVAGRYKTRSYLQSEEAPAA